MMGGPLRARGEVHLRRKKDTNSWSKTVSPAAAPTWLCAEDQAFTGLLGVGGRDAGTLHIRSHPYSLMTQFALLYVYFNYREP